MFKTNPIAWMGAAACPVFILLGATVASADIINVPADYPTIQKAINNAEDGDEVVVAPGTYFEKINFKGKAIWVRSSDGADVTTIDAEGNGSVVRCISGEDSLTVLEGFTITGGGGTFNGGGMDIDSSSPTVAHCTFIGNSATRGGGLANSFASPKIIECTFIDNAAGEYGGGMSNFFNSDPVLIGCTFEGNTAVYGGGGYAASSDSNGTLVECVFSNNYAAEQGGGAYAEMGSPVFDHCLFEMNHAAVSSELGGGGGAFAEYGDPAFYGCDFVDNHTPAWGGGFLFGSAEPVLLDCEFLGNSAGKGGGISSGYSAAYLVNCLFAENSADEWAGAYQSHRAAPTILNCTFASNSAPDTGGLRIKQDPIEGTTTVANCVLFGNEDDSGDPQHAQLSLLYADPDLISVDYSCIEGWTGLIDGQGNIADDPTFVDPAGGNYRLGDGSSCIDAASNQLLPDEFQTDLDGNDRLVDNPFVEDTGILEYGDPGVADMGAYEWQSAGCACDLNADGTVDVLDLLLLLDMWGACGNQGACTADLDQSSQVDVVDLLFLLADWGPCDQ